MALHKKVLLTIGVTIVCLIVILFVISQIFILSSFIELEEQDTSKNVERVLNVLYDEVSELDILTFDWAAWDDTYAFIEDANEDYVDSNLVDGTFTDSGLNLMLFINSSGQMVFGKAFDLQNEEEIPIPQSLLEHLSPNAHIIQHSDTESNITGIVLLPEAPMIIASRPILTSENEGPIRGTLIMGRYLDAAEIENLAEITQLSLSVHRLDDSQMPSDLQAAKSFLSEDTPVFTQPLCAESIAGYALIEDIYGSPALVLKTDMPRSIYRQGQTTVNYFILLILAIGLMFSVAILLFLNKSVLSPLSQLSDSVSSIGTSSDLSRRVSMTGKDEFSNLAGAINETLTSLEQSQHKLRESEEKLAKIVESMNIPAFAINSKHKITHWNTAVESLTGVKGEEVVGTDKQWMAFYAKKRPAMADLIVDEASESKIRAKYSDKYQKSPLIEGAYEASDFFPALGEEGKWLLFTAAPLRDADGNVIGAIETLQDLTERKQAEEGLEQLLKELEAKNAELERFSYTVSHDLASPLMAIRSFAELIREDLEQGKTEDMESGLKRIEKATITMDHLLSDLLELSRIGRIANSPEDVPFGAIVEEALEQTAGEITSNNIDVSIAEDFPTVHVDRMRIAEVLVNLITNSVRYRGEQPHPKIEIEYRIDNGERVFFVKDNGIGIDKSQQEKVFDLFYQVDESGKGTGAGLAIVKRIIEVHGGRIWIESEIVKGCTVCFTLPVV